MNIDVMTWRDGLVNIGSATAWRDGLVNIGVMARRMDTGPGTRDQGPGPYVSWLKRQASRAMINWT